MARRLLVAALCLLLVLPATVATAQSEQRVDDDAAQLDVYTAEVEPGDDAQLRKDGVDVIDVAPVEQADKDKETPTITVEMVLSPEEAAALEDKGVEVELKTNAEGQSVAEAATLRAEAGFNVWRPWSGAGGLQEEVEQLADSHADGVQVGYAVLDAALTVRSQLMCR